jgi:putative ABC transport system permease protein
VPVSLEDGIARELGLSLGDTMLFDVQGIPMPCRVASLQNRRLAPGASQFLRRLSYRSSRGAPAQYVIATRIDSAAESAGFQRDLLKSYPNVSTVDLTLVLQTLDTILSRVGFVIRFMALFTVVTGLIVLAGAIVTGRWQRLQESVVLRTLGASRRQVRQILLAEYIALGSLASGTGIRLAVAASAALSVFAFKSPPKISLLSLPVASTMVTALTAGMRGPSEAAAYPGNRRWKCFGAKAELVESGTGAVTTGLGGSGWPAGFTTMPVPRV